MRFRLGLCFLTLAASLTIVRCGHDLPTSPSATCSDVSGVYDVTYQGGVCSSQYPSQWTLVQSACTVQTQMFPDMPTVNGTVNGTTVHLRMNNGFTACLYQLEGDAQLDGRTLRGRVSGKISGPCCGDRNESLQFTATRR